MGTGEVEKNGWLLMESEGSTDGICWQTGCGE